MSSLASPDRRERRDGVRVGVLGKWAGIAWIAWEAGVRGVLIPASPNRENGRVPTVASRHSLISSMTLPSGFLQRGIRDPTVHLRRKARRIQ